MERAAARLRPTCTTRDSDAGGRTLRDRRATSVGLARVRVRGARRRSATQYRERTALARLGPAAQHAFGAHGGGPRPARARGVLGQRGASAQITARVCGWAAVAAGQNVCSRVLLSAVATWRDAAAATPAARFAGRPKRHCVRGCESAPAPPPAAVQGLGCAAAHQAAACPWLLTKIVLQYVRTRAPAICTSCNGNGPSRSGHINYIFGFVIGNSNEHLSSNILPRHHRNVISRGC